MMQEVAGSVAFVTGGGSGVGLGQAKVLARAGAKVVLADIREDHLEQALAHLREQGASAHAIRLDVTDRAAFARAADETERVFGPVQLLFNTAGVSVFGPLEKSTYEDYDWIMGVNFGGVVNGIQTFAPRMIAHARGGYIVNTASMSGLISRGTAGIYCASKFAVVGLSMALRESLTPYRIGVSVLCPGNVKTNIAESTLARPARLNNSGYHYDDGVMPALWKLYSAGMDPVELAEHVMLAMKKNELFVIPYPEMRPRLVAHFEAILAALPPEGSDAEGCARRNAAMLEYLQERQAIAAKNTPRGR
jgi:NAD(P)-dependent dehydrogenase (short-subunit alcohol dehydrogenase family)